MGSAIALKNAQDQEFKITHPDNAGAININSDDIVTDRIGMIDYAYVAKAYHIVAFGGEFNRADYPKLWAYLQANPSLVKTQAQWTSESTANGGICGFFSDGDGTTTFRVPNLDKAFLRPDNRGVGSFEKGTLVTADNFSPAVHALFTNSERVRDRIGGDPYNPLDYPNVTSIYSSAVGSVPISDASYYATTRPKNIAVLPLIVAK